MIDRAICLRLVAAEPERFPFSDDGNEVWFVEEVGGELSWKSVGPMLDRLPNEIHLDCRKREQPYSCWFAADGGQILEGRGDTRLESIVRAYVAWREYEVRR
jgi:hypothetical protein